MRFLPYDTSSMAFRILNNFPIPESLGEIFLDLIAIIFRKISFSNLCISFSVATITGFFNEFKKWK